MSDLESTPKEPQRQAAPPVAAVDLVPGASASLSSAHPVSRVAHTLFMLADNINEVYWVADPRAVELVYVSPAYEQIWGRSQESAYLAPRSFLEGIHADDRPRVEDALRQQAHGVCTELEYRVVRPDGSERWVRDRGFPVPGSGNDDLLVAGIAEDITERKQAETVLQKQRFRFSQCLRAAKAGAWEWNMTTNAVEWSDEIYELLGEKPTDSAPTFDTWLAHVLPEDRDRALKEIEECVAQKRDFNLAYRMVRGDGCVIWTMDAGTVVLNAAGRPQAMYGILMDVTDRWNSEQKMREYRLRLRSLAAELSRSEERERRRLAETLHDGVAQSLAMTRIHLKQLGTRVQDDDKAVTLLNSALGLVDRAVQDSRQLTHEISPPVLYELGLKAAIESLAEKFTRSHGLSIEIEASAGDFAAEDEIRFTLFKAVQELMTNVVKHAQATSVRVTLEDTDDAVTIIVQDDGCGFVPESVGGAPADAPKFGLFNIRDRLDYLGGSCTVESAEASGTRVVLRAPKHPQLENVEPGSGSR